VFFGRLREFVVEKFILTEIVLFCKRSLKLVGFQKKIEIVFDKMCDNMLERIIII